MNTAADNMGYLILIISLWALVQAKPEMYREKEDFSYSRSSSDDGSKSGYYGAQRGNMGGNYERAHNMDGLAQHQMSGLVGQVQGELGDSSKARTGSVFSSANSRGIYGSGNYDLSNVEGRNFAEGTSYGSSASQSSQTQRGYNGQSTHSSQSSAHSSQYSDSRSQGSRYDGYQQREQIGQTFQIGDQQRTDLDSGRYGYGSQGGSSKYNSHSGYQDQSGYRVGSESQQSGSGYESDGQIRTRLIGPQSRIIIRPGSRVTVPVAAQIYHAGQRSDAVHSSLSSSSSYDQRSEADSLRDGDRVVGYNPSGSPKYYESSSSYRKEWEKHNTVPVAVPTMPPRIEIYDASQASGIASHSSHDYSGYNADTQSSSQSKHQSDYSSQYQGSIAGAHSDETSSSVGYSGNLIGIVDSKPKNYQSSYAYHKAWERQGDPYVIVPSTKGGDDLTSQRLTSAYNHGSKSRQSSTGYSHGCSIQCDESSHLRMARSVDDLPGDVSYQGQSFNAGPEDMGQQVQTGWGNIEEDIGQVQSEWNQLEDLGQQSQSNWGEFDQQTQTDDELSNFAQQNQAKNDNSEDFGQQVQSSWGKENIPLPNTQEQNKVPEKQIQQNGQLETVEQNVQSVLEKNQSVQHSEATGQFQWQQSEGEWHDIQQSEQQTQNRWDQIEDLGQQLQHTWDKYQPTQTVDLKANGQQTQHVEQISDQVKPVWEQNQDDTVVIQNTTDPKISDDGQVYHRQNVHGNLQQSEFSSQANHSSHSTWHSSTQSELQEQGSHSDKTHDLQDLWKMIDDFEKESSKQSEDWSQVGSHGYSTNLSSSQSSHIHPQHKYNTHVSEFGKQDNTNKTQNHYDESGRGDISDLDEIAPSVATNETNSALGETFKVSDSDHKTLQSIETSNLKENILNSDVQNKSAPTDDQKSDTTLSVVSIQDWLNREKEQESSLQYKPVKPIGNTEIQDKNINDKGTEVLQEQKPQVIVHQSTLGIDHRQESQETFLEQAPEEIQQQEQSKLGINQGHKTEQIDQQFETSWGNTENIQKANQNTWENAEDLGQRQETWGKSNEFGQQVQNNWENSDDLGQKSQSAWGNSDDFGQQVQTSWQPSDTFQRSQSQQQSQDFTSLSTNDQVPDFYQQNYPKSHSPPVTVVHENVESHKVQNLNELPHNEATGIPTTTDAVTEKPGFWKNVGNKLSNAKEKVYSWFRKSE